MKMSCLAAVLSCFLCAAVMVGEDAKPAPPSDQQRQQVLQLLQEIYRAEYVAAKSEEAKSTLAKKIFTAAQDTSDSVARYAMLKLALDISVQAGDMALIADTIGTMDQHYQVDAVGLQLTALSAASEQLTAESEPEGLAAIVDFCSRAVDRDDYAAANQLIVAAAANFRDEASRRTLQQWFARLQTLQSQFDQVREPLEQLAVDPLAPEANLAVGKYRCFVRDDWRRGLENLARGSDPMLRQLAALELAGAPQSEQQLALADAWWAYAQTADESQAGMVKRRAGAYYALALASLQGLQKAKASTRLLEAKSLGEIPTLDMNADANPAGQPDGDPAQPAPMDEPKVVYELPASYSDLAVGGAGRYLIFRLDSLRKLACFDIRLRKVTQYIPLETSDVRFTAGANECFIAIRPQNVMERWSLETFKKLSTVKLPLEHPVEAVVMGSASDGPIYIGAEQGPGMFLNSRTLKPIPYEVYDQRYQRGGEIQGAGPTTRVRASANGQAFAMWQTRVSPGGFRTYVITPPVVQAFYQHDTMGYIEPSPDGELMYTARGVYTSHTKEFLANDGNRAQSFRVPAITGNYAVGIPRNDDRDKKNVNAVHIMVSGQVEPILTIPNVSIRSGEYGDFHGHDILTLARRVYLLPEAKLLITLPESNKSLVLHAFDLEQELRDSGVDYLYIASRAPAEVKSGTVYKYQIEAKGRHAPLTYQLAAGPTGIKVSNDGLVTWKTPRRDNEKYEIIVSVKDGQGGETSHAFTITTVP